MLTQDNGSILIDWLRWCHWFCLLIIHVVVDLIKFAYSFVLVHGGLPLLLINIFFLCCFIRFLVKPPDVIIWRFYKLWYLRRSVITYPKSISDIRNDIRKVISETLTSDIRNMLHFWHTNILHGKFSYPKGSSKVGLAWCHYPLQSPIVIAD